MATNIELHTLKTDDVHHSIKKSLEQIQLIRNSAVADGERSSFDDPYLAPPPEHVVEEVRMTVATVDDPSLPVWTVRMWVLGLGSCASLAFVNQFFQFRSEPMKVTALSATLAVLPLGHAMAYSLPTTTIRIPMRPFSRRHFTISLNPGPFNVKEHVLIAIFANAGNAFGYGGAFAVEMINLIKIFFKMQITFFVGLVLVLSSQLIGYGWAGLMRKLLIDSPYMWWPSTMVQVSLFRTLHEKEKKQPALSKSQVFYMITAVSFAYYVVPGYFMPWLTCISTLCLMWPGSVLANQLGSGYKGLGIGALTLDWAAVSSFLGSPLIFPASVLFNMMLGAGLFLYIVTPLLYYAVNAYNAHNFPIISSRLFTTDGRPYNVTAAMMHPKDPTIGQGHLYLSCSFAVAIALLFAAPLSTMTHFLLFHSKEVWQTLWYKPHASKHATAKGSSVVEDIHTRLMRHYPDIPNKWFLVLLLLCLTGVTIISVWFKLQVQIPWWGILLGCAIAALLTLPIGIIAATTNMTPSLMVVMQFLGGYLFPGNPVANQGLKLFGHMSMQQAIFFLQDFKLGHYMKIPPRSMFLVQAIGTIVAGSVDLGTAWWLYKGAPHLCNVDGKQAAGSAWTCPWDVLAYDTTIVWGVLGPGRTFGTNGTYRNLAYWMAALGGVAAPLCVWVLAKAFPNAAHYIRLINVPVILGAVGWMPAAGSINYTSWFLVGIIFNVYIFRRHKAWWQRYNYLLSAGLDAGTAIMGVMLSLAFMGGGGLDWWGGQSFADHCPLSSCALNVSSSLSNCPIYE